MTELNLWEFLEKREEEIITKRKELAAELQALRETRATLEASNKSSRQSDTTDRMTIKEMIRSVLLKNPAGGTSDQIINWISLIHSVDVARTSLSPQLSRLKGDEEVSLDELTGIWTLSEEAVRRERFNQGFRSRQLENENRLAEIMSATTREGVKSWHRKGE